MANGTTGTAGTQGNGASLEDMKKLNDDNFKQTMAVNMENKRADAQKEMAAAMGNAQKSGHDAMMQLIANLK